MLREEYNRKHYFKQTFFHVVSDFRSHQTTSHGAQLLKCSKIMKMLKTALRGGGPQFEGAKMSVPACLPWAITKQETIEKSKVQLCVL